MMFSRNSKYKPQLWAYTGRSQSPGPRIGPAPRIGLGPLSNFELRIGRRLRIGVSPMHIRDYQMLEPFPTPPSKAASVWDPRTALGGQHPERYAGSDPAPIPSIWRSPVSGTPGSRPPQVEETGDSKDKNALSPNMRWVLTRL